MTGPLNAPDRPWIACAVCEEFHPIAEFRWFNLEGWPKTRMACPTAPGALPSSVQTHASSKAANVHPTPW